MRFFDKFNWQFIKNQKKATNVFVTVDVEDKQFDTPLLITGEGLEEGYGIYTMMDELEKRNMQGVFFVNVYEHNNFHNKNAMKTIVKSISDRGHEVGLHSHAESSCLPYYRKEIFDCDLETQEKIIEYGRDKIEEYCGKVPISFRGGGYACDDNTFVALSKKGFKVDSSLWYALHMLNKKNNRLKLIKTINDLCYYSNILEIPVTTVTLGKKAIKPDVNWMDSENIIKTFIKAYEIGFNTATLFLHSFSFINRNYINSREEFEKTTDYKYSHYSPFKKKYSVVYDEMSLVHKTYYNNFIEVLDFLENDKRFNVLRMDDFYEQIQNKTYEVQNKVEDKVISCNDFKNSCNLCHEDWKKRYSSNNVVLHLKNKVLPKADEKNCLSCNSRMRTRTLDWVLKSLSITSDSNCILCSPTLLEIRILKEYLKLEKLIDLNPNSHRGCEVGFDLTKNEFSGPKYSVFVACLVFDYIYELKKAFLNINRVLKKDGVLLFYIDLKRLTHSDESPIVVRKTEHKETAGKQNKKQLDVCQFGYSWIIKTLKESGFNPEVYKVRDPVTKARVFWFAAYKA